MSFESRQKSHEIPLRSGQKIHSPPSDAGLLALHECPQARLVKLHHILHVMFMNICICVDDVDQIYPTYLCAMYLYAHQTWF